MLEALLDAVLDPWPPFTFCCPQAIVDEEAGVSIPNSSPFSRSTRFPFTSTASPPAPLAIRKAPSASVESIEPRPPRPCEVGRPKGRRRKNRRQSHNFFSTCCAWHPNSPPRPGEASHPAPSARKSVIRLHRKLPSAPLRAPRRFGIRKSASHSGHSPLRGLGGGLGDASPARRGSPSRTASPPAPLAIRKAPSGRRRKSRRQSHKFFKHLLRLAPQLAATPWGSFPPPPLCQKICYQTAQKTALCAPCEHPGGFGIRKSTSNSGHSPLRGLGGGLGDASPARRGSRSRPPLRRPRPLRFERLPVPVWNP